MRIDAILDDFAGESMYARDAWFLHEILELDTEAKRLVGRLDTTRLGFLVDQQRDWPLHERHLPGAVAVQMTATLGQLYAIHLKGLRASEGWVGFGTHIHKAKFGNLGRIGPPVEAAVTGVRERRLRGTWFLELAFRYTQEGKDLYVSTQTSAFVQSEHRGALDDGRG